MCPRWWVVCGEGFQSLAMADHDCAGRTPFWQTNLTPCIVLFIKFLSKP